MRIPTAARVFALTLALASEAQAAEIVAPTSLPLAQSVIAIPANTDTVLGSGTSRRYLCLMNIGTGLVTLGFDAAAVAGSGWALEGACYPGALKLAARDQSWEFRFEINSLVSAGRSGGDRRVLRLLGLAADAEESDLGRPRCPLAHRIRLGPHPD